MQVKNSQVLFIFNLEINDFYNILCLEKLKLNENIKQKATHHANIVKQVPTLPESLLNFIYVDNFRCILKCLNADTLYD